MWQGGPSMRRAAAAAVSKLTSNTWRLLGSEVADSASQHSWGHTCYPTRAFSAGIAGSSQDAAFQRKMCSQASPSPSTFSTPPSKQLHSSFPELPAGPHTTGGARKVVAVGISGGVDSAVAAMLLQQAGHDVVGVFMRNWDESEEKANANCSVEADLKDAQSVCRHLGIPLHEADFVSEYWTRVFSDFVAQCARGLTPNPDLACNRHIKFDALLRFAEGMGADSVATGHYARLRHCPEGGPSQLLQGLDPLKDQSYFLAAVPGLAFRHVLFPLGAWSKADVRRMATEAGIPSAARRSSAGICFIGRRSFGEFLEEYAAPLEGTFVDVEQQHRMLGHCRNMLALTHGQRAGISGAIDRMYVVGKDVVSRTVFVASGRNHPALFTASAQLRAPRWIAGCPPEGLTQEGCVQLGFRARYGQPAYMCTARHTGGQPPPAAGSQAAAPAVMASGNTFLGSRYSRLSAGDAAGQLNGLEISFNEPVRAITPQQEFVMYDGDVCLGAAPVAVPGITLHEQGLRLPPGYVFYDSVHQQQAAAEGWPVLPALPLRHLAQ